MRSPTSSTAVPHIDLRVHGDFVEWLAASGGTLAVTTYNSGKLAMFGAPEGRLEMHIGKLARPMGLAYNHGRFAVATREAIFVWQLRGGDFEFAAAHATGRLDVHELAFGDRGLCFANTRFNCLARPTERAKFRRVWTPTFVQRPASRDCCHLNGVGMRQGRPAMATAFCCGAAPGSWRGDERFQGGVVLDVRANRVAAAGLCMPHSPRWDGAHWWLCNSGEGTLCTFDPSTGACRAAAYLPGFTRGLAFAHGRAVVGLSRIRKRHILDAPPVRARHPRLRSGVWLVDPASEAATGALEFVRGGREVFDVAFLAGVVRPGLRPLSPAPDAP
jgi:uncharacterized protein (TIGR03032 family)